jgi:hypothetical protein
MNEDSLISDLPAVLLCRSAEVKQAPPSHSSYRVLILRAAIIHFVSLKIIRTNFLNNGGHLCRWRDGGHQSRMVRFSGFTFF